MVNGIPQDFNQDLANDESLYLHQKVETEYYKEDNANVQKSTTYTSIAARGSGIGAGPYRLDASRGVVTSEIRRSVTIGTIDVRPDSVNAATTAVKTEESLLPLTSAGGFSGPTWTGPYTIEESVPVPFLFNTLREVQNAKGKYENYVVRFVEGDSRGLQIGEGLRRVIGRDWTPNMPFRYFDPTTNELFAYRMDATSWTLTPEGCALATSAIWIDDMAGGVDMPDNLVGNTMPNMDVPTNPPLPEPDPVFPEFPEPQPEPEDGSNGPDAPTPDPDPDPDPDVPEPAPNGPNLPVNRSYRLTIDVPFFLDISMKFSGSDGVIPIPGGPQDVIQNQTLVIWCGGSITEPGALISDGDGGVILTEDGDMIVDDSLVIIEDLFAEDDP